eukprot:Anaeramoba_ignava/a218327_14.p1 GENE.a218327_14~~a218327_14.p1  ORF type:complete len:301 (+),score=17.79 a218327_14:699-1601(+)
MILVLELKKNITTSINPFLVSIYIEKCFNMVDHRIIRKVIKKFIVNIHLKKFLINYYKGNSCDIYKGDLLTLIIFAMVSHFITMEIEPYVKYIQMYVDDLIILVEETKKYCIRKNQNKTIISKKLYKIKYLGIILDPRKHIQHNFEKAKNNFTRLKNIMSLFINNHLKMKIYKTVIIPKIIYGTETLIFTQKEYHQIDTLINPQITQNLRINRHTPVKIYRNETNTPDSRTQINIRKWKLRKKLGDIDREYLQEFCIIDSNLQEKVYKIWGKEDLKYIQNYLLIQRLQDMKESKSWKTKE